MKSLSRVGFVIAAGLALVGSTLAACGGGNQGNAGSFGGGGASSHPAGGGSSTSHQGGGSPDGGFSPVGPSGSSVSGTGGSTCGGTVSMADPIPLDIFIMLDQSGSMAEPSQGFATKWAAVSKALKGFFADPASAGINVGIQFFPLLIPGVPASCTSDPQCPQTSGPCTTKTCDDGSGVITPCKTSSDCGGDSCIPLGQCAGDPSTYCVDIGQDEGGTCGMCRALSAGFCPFPDSCSAAQYGTPEVPIATLDAGQISALGNAITAHGPTGATPTSAALSGALDYAKADSVAHPDHAVVVVFATDGIPSECDPQDANSIAAIAGAAATGSPPIKTYVIGVLNQIDMLSGAKQTLTKIATQGQGQAFIINASNQNVEQQFVAAMNTVRGGKLACEYAVPPPSDGGTQDFDKVNVEYTPSSGGAQTIGYVGSAANCDPQKGGWYYDVDPQQGTPTKILMCPATCSSFDSGGKVQIQVGCATIHQPPPK